MTHKHRWTMVLPLIAALLFGICPTAWAAPQAPVEIPATVAAERKRADGLFEQAKYDEAKLVYAHIASSYAADFEFNMRLAYCYYVSKGNEMARAAVYFGRAHAIRPKNVEAELSWAKALSWSKQYPKAIEAFRRILQRDPSDRDTWLELARAQNYGSDVAGADATYQTILKRWPADHAVRVEYAQWLSWNKRYDESLANFQIALKEQPRNATYVASEAQVLAWKGDLQNALALYDRALALSPRLYDALRGKAFVLMWQQKFEEADKFFVEANKRRRPDADVQRAMDNIAKWRAEAPQRRLQAELDVYLKPASEAVTRGDFSAAIELFRKALSLAPENVDLRFRLAEANLWDRRWEDAIPIFEKLHGEQPDDINFVRELGNAYAGAKRYADAVGLLRKQLERKPDAAIRLELARVLSWAGKLDDSVAEYRALLAQQPDNIDAALGLAFVTAWQGHSAEALASFEKILQQHPDSREAQLGRAQVLAWSGRANEAVPLLEAMSESRPRDREIAGVLQAVREALRQQDEQQRVVAAGPKPLEERIRHDEASLQEHPDDVKLLERLGDAYAELKKYGQAISYYEKALGREPKDVELLLRAARVTSWNRDFARSTDLYRQLAVLEDKREYHVEMARVLSWSGRNSESIAEYRTLLAKDPDDVSVRLDLARVLSWDKKTEEALAEYERVLHQEPQNRNALFERARTYAWKGDYKTALTMYDTLLLSTPADADIRLAKAQVLNWMGEPREAKAIIDEIQKGHPVNRDVTLAEAAVQSSLGRRDLALRLLDQLDKLQPGNHDVESLRQSIQNDLRPVLLLGFIPSFDSGSTNIYASRATLYFSPQPQIRSYVSMTLIPSFLPNALGSETGREFLFGSYGRVNSRLLLRGEIGANVSSAGTPGAIGGGGATYFVTDKIQFDFDVSRRYINYLPQPVQLDISRIQYRAAWNWRATRRTTFHADFYHERYSDSNRNNGGNASVLQNVLNRERVKVELGYLFANSAFDHVGNSGFFTPTSFTRHAAVGNTYITISKKSSISFWGSLGREEVFGEKFRWDGTARTSWDHQLTPNLKSSIGYGYFAVSSVGGSTAYITHTMYSTLQYTF